MRIHKLIKKINNNSEIKFLNKSLLDEDWNQGSLIFSKWISALSKSMFFFSRFQRALKFEHRRELKTSWKLVRSCIMINSRWWSPRWRVRELKCLYRKIQFPNIIVGGYYRNAAKFDVRKKCWFSFIKQLYSAVHRHGSVKRIWRLPQLRGFKCRFRNGCFILFKLTG